MFQKIKNIANFINRNKIILLIILVAVYLRFVGITPGYTFSHPDEAAYGSALVMISNKNLDPLRFDYPAGAAVINYIFFRLIFIPFYWLKFYLGHLGPILDGIIKIPLSSTDQYRYYIFEVIGQRDINALHWGRYITALFGVGVVFLIYRLGSKLFSKVVGLTAALFVAVNFREVLNSHLGLMDIYNAFFLVLSFLVSWELFKNHSRKNYLISAIVMAVSFSIKYQIYGLIPFVIVHLVLCIKQTSWKDKLKFIFNPHFLIVPLAFMLTVLIINPYHLINWDQMLVIVSYVGKKYAFGSNSLDLYPLAYLYQYGIGAVFSLLIIFGIIYGLKMHLWKSLFLLVVIVPFFVTFIYLSRGGFYTRNFVTILPLCLLFAGLAIEGVYRILKIVFKNTIVANIIVVLLLVPVLWSNIENSLVIVKTYTKDWNFNILSAWVEKNIPKSSRVAAHINVPLPVENVQRIFYDPEHSFSIDEFIQEGADYAIGDFSWATTGFYWWMNGPPKTFLKYYWPRPLGVLEYSYPALALRELQEFSVFPVFKPWQAPDTDYLVVKVPRFKVSLKEKVLSYDFKGNSDGWIYAGFLAVSADGLNWREGSIGIDEKTLSSPSARWQSQPIKITDWPGLVIDYKIKSESMTSNVKSGYIYVNYYMTEQDAQKSRNRLAVRLSRRNTVTGKWINQELVGTIPPGANYITICFANYESTTSETRLGQLTLYKAMVKADFGGVKVVPYRIDDNNIFPVSQGNL